MTRLRHPSNGFHSFVIIYMAAVPFSDLVLLGHYKDFRHCMKQAADVLNVAQKGTSYLLILLLLTFEAQSFELLHCMQALLF